MSQQQKPYSKAEWIIAAVILISGFIFWASSCSGPDDSKVLSPEQARVEQLRQQFSAWDGSHRGVTASIKRSMNDPDSYEHVETRYSDQGSHLIVVTTFRGANAFGGKVLTTVKAKTDLHGNVLEIAKQ